MTKIRVVVSGAKGRVGQEVLKAVMGASDLELVGAVDINALGEDAGKLCGLETNGVKLISSLEDALKETAPDVMVDFTAPNAVLANIKSALSFGVRPVVGTTGMGAEELEEIRSLACTQGIGCLVAPNFAIGAVLMMRFAREASRFLPDVEIIELHHEKKLDAPSGTALKTAELIIEERSLGDCPAPSERPKEEEKVAGARGGDFHGIRMHSVRLPGLIAHQEVIFGGLGQTLTIRHDSYHRESFMPGVVLGIRKVMEIDRLVYGLDNLIF